MGNGVNDLLLDGLLFLSFSLSLFSLFERELHLALLSPRPLLRRFVCVLRSTPSVSTLVAISTSSF